MRVHVSVTVLTLFVGLGVGFGIAQLVATEHQPNLAAESLVLGDQPIPAPQASDHPGQKVPVSPAGADTAIIGEEPAPSQVPGDTLQGEQSYAMSALVVNAAHEPVAGLRFRWEPDLWDQFQQRPAPSAGQSDSARHEAMETHIKRIAALQLRGTMEVVSDADGRIGFSQHIAKSGRLVLLTDGWSVVADDAPILTAGKERKVWVARKAELRVIALLADGSHAEGVTLVLTFSGPRLRSTVTVRQVTSPATLSVPAGSATASFSGFEGSSTIEEVKIDVVEGVENLLRVQAAMLTTLTVRRQVSHGVRASIRLKPAKSGLTGMEIANSDDVPQATITAYKPEYVTFRLDVPGKYILYSLIGRAVVGVQEVEVRPGPNETTLFLEPPEGWKALTVRISTEGRPLPEADSVYIFADCEPRGLLWSRTEGQATFLIPPAALAKNPLNISAHLDKYGALATAINPASENTVDFNFVKPGTIHVVLKGFRDEMVNNVTLTATGAEGGLSAYRSVSSYVREMTGAGETRVRIGNVQPGQYEVALTFNAGIELHGRISLGVVTAQAGDVVETLTLPPLHILTIALSNREVRGYVNVRPVDGGQDTNVLIPDGAPRQVRFLKTGEYALEWTDTKGAKHKHTVNVDGDTVFRPDNG